MMCYMETTLYSQNEKLAKSVGFVIPEEKTATKVYILTVDFNYTLCFLSIIFSSQPQYS